MPEEYISGHSFSFLQIFDVPVEWKEKEEKHWICSVDPLTERRSSTHTVKLVILYISDRNPVGESQPVSWPPPSPCPTQPSHTHTQSIPYRISAVHYKQLPECFQTSNTSQTKETEKINYNTNTDPLSDTHTHARNFSDLCNQSHLITVCHSLTLTHTNRHRERKRWQKPKGFGWMYF